MGAVCTVWPGHYVLRDPFALEKIGRYVTILRVYKVFTHFSMQCKEACQNFPKELIKIPC